MEPPSQFSPDKLTLEGLITLIGPFRLGLQTSIEGLIDQLETLYSNHPMLKDDDCCDFRVRMDTKRSLRTGREMSLFRVDGRPPFPPSPVAHALANLEWGINWCIATRAHHLLMLHCAVVERDGLAVLFPAWPGHGKSTLCTALVHSGWRLLSDEFGLVRPEDGAILPIPRLIPLKNESIEVIRSFAPQAYIGPSFYGTRKGTVAHVRPPAESVERQNEVARPGWLVFPRWVKDSPLKLEPMPKAQSFLMVATNAFNYEVLGETAFRLVGDMVRTCECFSLTYSDLDEAVTALDRLTRGAHG